MQTYNKVIPLISSYLFVLDQGKFIAVSLRPMHWIKNLFLFPPLLFSGHFRNYHDVYLVVSGFIVFSLVASSVYLFNDIIDKDRDARSARNKNRPIAEGDLSIPLAATIAAILLFSAAIVAYCVQIQLLFILLLYGANNVAYTLYIKRKAIVDIISIAVGFLIRILGGAVLINVEISHWLLICVFNLSLLIGFGKRRLELLDSRSLRQVNEIYTESKLDQMMSISAATTLFSYILYTVSPESIARFGNNRMIYTVIFVVYGIFRYIAKIQEGKFRDPIQLIYSDKIFAANISLWLITVLVILFNAYPL